MEQSYTRPKLQKSMNLRMRGFFRTLFTILVIAAVPVVLICLYKTESNIRFNGVVDSGGENVGPVEASRIVQICVEQGQFVKAGDILVRFDSAQRLLDESMNDIKIRELEQRLVNRRDELIETERRCREIVRKAECALEEALKDQERDESELAGYEEELSRLEPLIQKKLVSETDVMKIRPQVTSLRRLVKQYKPFVETLKGALASAQDDLKEASQRRVQGEGEVEKALESIESALERSEAIRKANPSVLRALSDGCVSKIFHRPGDIVVEGEPIVRLNSDDGTTMVTGMLPIGMQDAVKVGDKVYVTRRTFATGKFPPSVPAFVASVDSEVMDLFETSGRDANTTVRGRKVRIQIQGDVSSFIPGEPVTITDKPLDEFSSIFKSSGSVGASADK